MQRDYSIDTEEISSSLRLLDKITNIHILNNATSTNDVAKDIAIKGAKEGTIVIANSQTHGRGRKANQWYSPPHVGIYISIILKPKAVPNTLSLLSLMAGVATATAIKETAGLKCGLKWPNDIMVDGKKLGGILIETSTFPKKTKYVIVGLGVNVNNASFPDSLRLDTTSIFIETKRILSKKSIIYSICRHLFNLYGLFLSGDTNNTNNIINMWLSFSTDINKKIKIRYKDDIVSVTVIGISPVGHIIVKTDMGETLEIANYF